MLLFVPQSEIIWDQRQKSATAARVVRLHGNAITRTRSLIFLEEVQDEVRKWQRAEKQVD